MLATGTVFHKARDKTIFGISTNNQCGHFGLTEFKERLEPPLSTDKIIRGSVPALPRRDSKRSLQADLGNVLDNAAENLFVAQTRVDYCDPVNRNHFNPLGRERHD
ncbi:hypothetical protein Sbs19_38260 [Sphingobium sp. BS19]|nr:hypothetical protein Sbs19_38260 [Sphingobium sp. BS19]